MASEATFTYRPMKHEHNIRLIEIRLDSKPSLEINLIECRLGSEKFEALSYVWGKQTTKKQIKCNGQIMHIGSNLLGALSGMARRRLASLVWIDAICINQHDNREKTRQVRMMRDIYNKAQRVIIWLGIEQVGDQKGYGLAKALYQMCDGANYNMNSTTFDFKDFDCASKGIPEPFRSPDWTAIFHIISHPWFSRIWIVQELLVAQKSTMWRGGLDLDTDIILWMALQVGRHKNLYERFDIFMNSPPISALMARNIATGYMEFKRDGPRSIYDTLSRYNGMEATDPRDRYFALAGITDGLDRTFVDYNKSYRDIACLVGKMALLDARGYLLQSGGVEMLSFPKTNTFGIFPIEWLAFHANPQNHNLCLPSWVPDVISPHSPGFLMSGFYNTLFMGADMRIVPPRLQLRRSGVIYWSGSSPPQCNIPVPEEIDIMGAVFDCVGALARERPPLPRANSAEEFIGRGFESSNIMESLEVIFQYETKMVQWLSEIRTLADPTLQATGSIMSGSCKSFDCFWRTLVYNRGPHFDNESPNQKPTSDLGISFGYWFLWKKLVMKRLWQQSYVHYAIFSQFLRTLAGPFDLAEGRVRDARRFFVSKNGRFGWVPLRTEVRDRVCVFRGMRIPIIMRPQGNRWEFIGACYVHEWMDGEIWDIDDLQWRFMSFV